MFGRNVQRGLSVRPNHTSLLTNVIPISGADYTCAFADTGPDNETSRK